MNLLEQLAAPEQLEQGLDIADFVNC